MKKLLLDSLQKLDFIIWGITLLFFIWSAVIMWWNIDESFMWASWIIVLMFLVWFSIELILAGLQHVKWVWKITWFITNGPEALVLVVWLISGNILFAASTPLGSNVMNPILLVIAIIISWFFLHLQKFQHKKFFIIGFILTAILATIFFKIPQEYYLIWILVSLSVSIYLFSRKFVHEESPEVPENEPTSYLIIWVIILLISWYFLDPVVNFTADASLAPKWLIWFLVLATLTSWPEFKSVIALMKRKKTLDAFMNILVSNITNIWLAISWVIVWLIIK